MARDRLGYRDGLLEPVDCVCHLRPRVTRVRGGGDPDAGMPQQSGDHQEVNAGVR
jgi:hypothetical protein